MPRTASPTMVRQTERWFVRRGTPTMIEGYGFVTHVLPRMLPALSFVALGGLAWLVLLRTVGSWRWMLLAGIVGLALVVWTTTSLFVRRLSTFSRRTTITILATALATAYGLGALLRRAIRHTVYDLRNSARLLGRALPALLFVTLFLFFTGELWQAMNRLEWWRLGLVVGLFAAITVLAAGARLRDEIRRVDQDLDPDELVAACQGTPLARVDPPAGPVRPVPLTGRQSRNLLVMLATRQLMQAAVVGLALFAFFLVLGLTVVKPETAEQWIGAPPVYSSLLPSVPAALLRNATLLAAFGSMYFAVTSMIDTDHRRQFFAPIIDDIERTLTVRAVYLAVSTQDAPSHSEVRDL